MVTTIPVRLLSGKKTKSNYLLNYSSYYNVEGESDGWILGCTEGVNSARGQGKEHKVEYSPSLRRIIVLV